MQAEAMNIAQANPCFTKGDVMRTRSQIGQVTCVGTLLALMLTPLVPAQPSNTSTITVRIMNARNARGEIRVALFRNAEGFPGDASKAFRTQHAQIDPQTLSAQVVFAGIPPEGYAVSVFHDENMNGKLDKNLLGMPKEGYGASNNPGKKMRPPIFDEAKFSLNSAQLVEIRLIY